MPLLSVQRDPNGKRLYNKQDVYLLLKLKHYVQEKQLTLTGAKEALLRDMTEQSTYQHQQNLGVLKKLEDQRTRFSKIKNLLSDTNKDKEKDA